MNDKTEQAVTDALQYADRDHMQLDQDGGYYTRHVSAMTGEQLHSKSAIAGELAWRDQQIDTLRADLDRAIVNFGDAAATVCDMRAQLAKTERELVAKEAERAAMELERNNAQRQHTMQCAINKIDSQRILELTAENDLLRQQALALILSVKSEA